MSDQKKATAGETPEAASTSNSTDDVFGKFLIIVILLSLLGIGVGAFSVGDGFWGVVRIIAASVLTLATAVMALVSAGLIRGVVFSRRDDRDEMIGEAIIGALGILVVCSP